MDTTYDQQTERTFKAEYSDLDLGPSLQGNFSVHVPSPFFLFYFLFAFTASVSFLSPFFCCLAVISLDHACG